MPYANITTRKIITNFDVTAEEWDMYTTMDCSDAVKSINQTIVLFFNACHDRDTVRRMVHKEMEKHRKVGAFDTEPRAVLEDVLDELYN